MPKDTIELSITPKPVAGAVKAAAQPANQIEANLASNLLVAMASTTNALKAATKTLQKGKLSAVEVAGIAADAQATLAAGEAAGLSSKILGNLNKQLLNLHQTLAETIPQDNAGGGLLPGQTRQFEIPQFDSLEDFEIWIQEAVSGIKHHDMDPEQVLNIAKAYSQNLDNDTLSEHHSASLENIAGSLKAASKEAKKTDKSLQSEFNKLSDNYTDLATEIDGQVADKDKPGGGSLDADPDKDFTDKITPEIPDEVAAAILAREALTEDFGPLLKDLSNLETLSDALDWLTDVSKLSNHPDLGLLTQEFPDWVEGFPAQNWNADFLNFLYDAGQGADSLLDAVAAIAEQVEKSEINDLQSALQNYGGGNSGASTRAVSGVAPLPDPDLAEFFRLARRFPDEANRLLRENAAPTGITPEGIATATQALEDALRIAGAADAPEVPTLNISVASSVWLTKMLALGLSVAVVTTVLAVTLTIGGSGNGTGDQAGGSDDPQDFDIIDEQDVTRDWSEADFDIVSEIINSFNVQATYGAGDDEVTSNGGANVDLRTGDGNDVAAVTNT